MAVDVMADFPRCSRPCREALGCCVRPNDSIVHTNRIVGFLLYARAPHLLEVARSLCFGRDPLASGIHVVPATATCDPALVVAAPVTASLVGVTGPASATSSTLKRPPPRPFPLLRPPPRPPLPRPPPFLETVGGRGLPVIWG